MINKNKDKIQKKALKALLDNGGSGLIALCTGGGKSKLAIDYCKYLIKKKKTRFCLIVPTEKLRDNNWKEEFKQWDAFDIYNTIDRYCYASISKVKDEQYDLVILDEAHNITENNVSFFENNQIANTIALTATPPKDDIKIGLLKELKLNTVLHVTLDEGVELGIVAPYNITVIEMQLDDTDKYITAGNKVKPFMTTESAHYTYLTRCIQKMMYKGDIPPFMYLNRMRFIYNLKSKTIFAKKILDTIPDNKRVLIFCGSKEQSEELCDHYYHSGNEKQGSKWLNEFIDKQINRLSSVKKLNEGMNIPDLDYAVIVQLNSNDLDLVQRIGRVVRLRKNHTANIIILSVLQTQDEKWVKKALETFSNANIKYVYYKNY